MTTFHVSDLREVGWSRARLRAALRSGAVRRVARGWYSDAQDREVEAALALHGRVGCLTGLRRAGVWTWDDRTLHVVTAHQRGAIPPAGTVLHTDPGLDRSAPVQGVAACLRHVIAEHDAETALISLESAAHLELVSCQQVRELIGSSPMGSRSMLERFCDRSESGSETRVRSHLAGRGVQVQAQVWIQGVGRVDMLVGQSLVIECDSRTYHQGDKQFHDDRLRDLLLVQLGYTVIRLTWDQIFLEWEWTQQMLSILLSGRRHRNPPRPGAPWWLPELHRPEWYSPGDRPNCPVHGLRCHMWQ